jgi:hypothetical protein
MPFRPGVMPPGNVGGPHIDVTSPARGFTPE